MAVVFIGIGSNLGDRRANIDKALFLLREDKRIEVMAVSTIIESAPQGIVPQGDFLNGVAKIKTDYLPLELLSRLKMIERRLGRVKTADQGPRTMDLDILFYDDVVIKEGKRLSIPHPKLTERSFVLGPMAELEPDYRHPRLKKTIQELCDENCARLKNA